MNDGPAVVLLHGIRTSRTMWRAQLEALERDGLRVIAVDLPGHGERMGEEFTIAAALAAVDDALASVGEPVLLVGLSLGGYIAMHYAALHGDRVAGLVAASCSALPRRMLVGGYAALAGAIRRLPDKGSRLNDRMARMALPEAAVADLLAGGIALDVMASGLRAIGTLHPLADLAAYDGPVWIVNGALDHFRIDERRMLAAAPHARSVRIRGATHLASLARPAEFTAVIRDAQREVAGDRRTDGADSAASA